MSRESSEPFDYVGRDEARRIRAEADGVTRADTGLRQIALREGDATFCRKCDGACYIERPSRHYLDHIMKCPRCGGEGLEPIDGC